MSNKDYDTKDQKRDDSLREKSIPKTDRIAPPPVKDNNDKNNK